MHFPEEMKDSQKDAANARCKKFLVRLKCNTAVILRKGPGGAALQAWQAVRPRTLPSSSRATGSRAQGLRG